ncbi:MAG: hypothetical protein AUG17_06735 [Crenarchaeota archaeon 13_1_20CM_2_53_14]|nr:MAG: hypothetical protein AUG17_06735 [Crenarchaeota archaeon 13_1_20CM_2_53_14]
MTPRQSIATTIVLALLGFELIVLAILAFFPYLPDPGLATLNMSLYTLLAPLSTILLLGLLYAWLVRLVTREASRRSSSFNAFTRFLSEPFQKLLSSVKNTSLSESAYNFEILSRPKLMLTVSIVVSVLLVFVPYRPDLNPTGDLVGVDSPTYVGWLGQMLALPLPGALRYSFVGGLDGSRPLLLVLLYLVGSAGVSPSQIIEYLPLVLAPMLTLSVYIFARYGQGNASFAALAGLFTPVSFYTTVGLWGGYYANWLALIMVYLFMTCLLIFSRSPSAVNYCAMYILSVTLFLTHPYTWVMIVMVSLVFAISLWKETKSLVHVKSVIPIIATGIVIDIVKSFVFATQSVAAGWPYSVVGGAASLLAFWNNLVEALLYTHGGLLASWLVLGMGLLAVFALRFKDWFDRLLLLWVAIGSIPFPALDSYLQARILYDLPIPVLLSLAVLFYLPQTGNRNMRLARLIATLLLVTIANYAVQGILFL